MARKAVDSILKRGEDERDVRNGMTSFTNFELLFFILDFCDPLTVRNFWYFLYFW